MDKNLKIDIEKYRGHKIALALSGGRDSIALAQCLLDEKADFFAVNVEHGIRGESSLNDSRFVARFCDKNNIVLKRFSVNAPEYALQNALSVEQAARDLRYSVFNKLIDGKECDYVALAHHADDQTETILMRILRGTGIKGLAGMSAENGKFIRPFIGFGREEIDAFIKERGLEFVEDETNGDETYTRNFLRGELKRLKKRFPFINSSFARLSRNAAEIDGYLDSVCGEPFVLNENESAVSAESLSEKVLAKRLILKAAKAVGVFQDIEERHFELIFNLANSKNGARLDLAHNLTVYKEGERLIFARESDIKKGETSSRVLLNKSDLSIGKRIFFGGAVFSMSENGSGRKCGVPQATQAVGSCDNAAYQWFKPLLKASFDKLPDNAELRFRKEGDYIQKFGGGTKSLGDFLTDKKVPKRLREKIPVVASGSEILVTAGVEISNKLKIDEQTRNVLIIETDGFNADNR